MVMAERKVVQRIKVEEVEAAARTGPLEVAVDEARGVWRKRRWTVRFS
jgi:hypothetical protein